MKWYELNKTRVEVTRLENEADERRQKVCSKGTMKHSEMNGL